MSLLPKLSLFPQLSGLHTPQPQKTFFRILLEFLDKALNIKNKIGL